ncbi:MAG: methyltransferase domain-containing protein [Candidatus Latescibacterota bacterium]|nr:MAG: methyltransferase domain-containing protein [Candidatus Latescibacterota bacterium]
MKRATLDLLCCPDCRGALSLDDEHGDDVVNEGTLSCSHCGRDFLIGNGIVRFISHKDLEGLNRYFARFYDRFSRFEGVFDKLSFLSMGGERKARMEILHRLEHNNGRILEVSIGTGRNLPYLFESAETCEVYGLDISAPQLARCLRLADKRGWPVELFLGMAEVLPFRSETFNSVFHIGGINFFYQKKKAIDEMIRVARPGCKIVIADESERVARFIARLLRLSRSNQGKKVDTSVPVHLIPETMEEIRVDGIWKRHGQYHGYCLEFRKPA